MRTLTTTPLRSFERVVCDFTKTSKLPPYSKPVLPLSKPTIRDAASGGFKQFSKYSPYTSDWLKFQYSCHALESQYIRIRNHELNEIGKKRLQVSETLRRVAFGGNCISVGIEGKDSTSIMATAHHCVAEYIDSFGNCVDKHNIICGTTIESSGYPVYKLDTCVLDPHCGGTDHVDLIDYDVELDLACIKSGNAYDMFMSIDYEAINNPKIIESSDQFLMMGIRTYAPDTSSVDCDGNPISSLELDSLFGKEGEESMMGLTMPIQDYEAIIPSQGMNECGKGVEFYENFKFKHYLNSLPGFSGCGISRICGKIFAIHHSADNANDDTVYGGNLSIQKCRFNCGSLISDCITKYLQ